MSTSHEHAVAGIVQLPRALFHCAIDLTIYGVLVLNIEIDDLLDRVRVDGTFGRVA